jgi:hypothetical protein
METLVALLVHDAPEHRVLPGASRYDIHTLVLVSHGGPEGAVLEVHASTHDDHAVLKFTGVEELFLHDGAMLQAIRLVIQDTSACPSNVHYIPPVRVGGADPLRSGLSFWAQSVERVAP